MPNTNSPDPNFGKCMQCVAIDRARYKVNPTLERSSFCTQCFQQYCFDPNNQTSMSELPGRQLKFVNPNPLDFSVVLDFLSQNKIPIILGFLALFLAIAVLCVFLCVHFPLSPWASELIPTSYFFFFGRIRRKRRARRAEEQEMNALHNEDEPLFFHHHFRDSSRSDTPRDPELNHLPEIAYVTEERRLRR